MSGYTKMHCSMLDSSIWDESDAMCKVWVTMLLMTDKHGDVIGSVRDVAKRARQSIETTEECIAKLMAPDPYSKNQDCGGARIAKHERGWFIVSYDLYRNEASHDDKKSKAAERQQRKRDRDKLKSMDERHAPSRSVTHSNGSVTPKHDKAEAEAEAEAYTPPLTPPLEGKEVEGVLFKSEEHEAKPKRIRKAKAPELDDAPPVNPPGPFHVWLGKNRPGVDLPPNLHTERCVQAAKEWVTYRAAERKQPYLGSIHLGKEVANWAAFSADEFPVFVDDSIHWGRTTVKPKMVFDSNPRSRPVQTASQVTDSKIKAIDDAISKHKALIAAANRTLEDADATFIQSSYAKEEIETSTEAIEKLHKERENLTFNPVPA